jgi:hypothetical protein
MLEPLQEDEPLEASDTGRILIRAALEGAQFDKALRNSQRLARWIRRRLKDGARNDDARPAPSRR